MKLRLFDTKTLFIALLTYFGGHWQVRNKNEFIFHIHDDWKNSYFVAINYGFQDCVNNK